MSFTSLHIITCNYFFLGTLKLLDRSAVVHIWLSPPLYCVCSVDLNVKCNIVELCHFKFRPLSSSRASVLPEILSHFLNLFTLLLCWQLFLIFQTSTTSSLLTLYSSLSANDLASNIEEISNQKRSSVHTHHLLN